MIINGDYTFLGALDARNSPITAPIRVGSGAPTGNCTVGDVYYRNDWPTIGLVRYLCATTNVWTCFDVVTLLSDLGQSTRLNNTVTTAQPFNKEVSIPNGMLAQGRVLEVEADWD